MTEQLRTLLHDKADGVDFAAPDLDRMAADGGRRIRRRRSAVAGGVLSIALVVGAGAALGGRGGHDSAPVVAHSGPTARVVSWSEGSVIHAGDRTIDVGHDVHAFVETSVGYVVADPDGKVWSVADGDVAEVGTTSKFHPRLVADPTGPLAAWSTPSFEGQQINAVDQSSGRVSSPVSAPHAPGEVDALSGTTLYFHDKRGAIALDMATQDERVVDPKGTGESFEGLGVVAAHDGVLALTGERGTLLGTTRKDAVQLDQIHGSIGTFSPDGAYYSGDDDFPSVWEVASGRQVPVTGMDGYSFATGYAWLDDHTLVLIAEKTKSDPMVLVTCQIPEGGSCRQAATLGDPDAPDFELPVGEPIGD